MKDTEIIIALQQNDPFALKEAITIYSKYVMAVIEKTLGNMVPEEDKEELSADTFVALWKNSHKLKENSTLKYWLAVVARNAAINKLHAIRPADSLEENFIITDTNNPDTIATQNDLAQTLKEAISSLGSEDEELFLRHYFWYQTISEIAKETGITPSTIKSKLFRGRKILKTHLIERGFQYE